MTRERRDGMRLGMPAARWTFVTVWALGALGEMLQGRFRVTNVVDWAIHDLLLIAVLLLTARGTSILPRRYAWALVTVSFAAALLSAVEAQNVGEMWRYSFATFIVALMVGRGNMAIGIVGGVANIAVGVAVTLSHRAAAEDALAMVGPPAVALAVGVLWRLILERAVREEREHRGKAARARLAGEIADESAHRNRRELAEIYTAAGPLLRRISRGDEIDAATRTTLAEVEGSLRDRIRSPRLRHPVVIDAVAAARRRGVRVVMLGEYLEQGETLGEAVAEVLAQHIRRVREGSITVRGIPDGRKGAVSMLVETGEYTQRVLFDADGSVIERH